MENIEKNFTKENLFFNYLNILIKINENIIEDLKIFYKKISERENIL